MNGSIKKKIISHKREYPRMEMLLNICGNPNPMTLWRRVKNELGDKIDANGNHFDIKKRGYGQRDLIDDIRNMHNERLDYESESD
jgi:hypothetical protein